MAIAVEFLINSDGPDYVYTPGGPSWNDIFSQPPLWYDNPQATSNSIPSWESAAATASTVSLIILPFYYPLAPGASDALVFGQSLADVAYATALVVYENALIELAIIYDNATYTAAFFTWLAAFDAWVAAGQPGLAYGPPDPTFTAASITFYDTFYTLAAEGNPGAVALATEVLTAAYNTNAAAYESTYVYYLNFLDTLTLASEYNAANPTLPNPYSSINVV